MIAALTDLETTGFLEPDHRIVEVYIDLVDLTKRQVIFSYEKRINPERSMPAAAMAVHGISGAELLNCRTWQSVGPDVAKVLSKASLFVAHNAEFDYGFLNQELPRIGLPALSMPVLCTMEDSIWAAPTGKKPSLRELCFAMDVEYDPSKAHAASYDVGVMRECLFRGMSWGWYDLPALQNLAA